MCRAELDRTCSAEPLEQPVEESRRERVAAADAVEDLELGPVRRLVDALGRKADGTPAVAASPTAPRAGSTASSARFGYAADTCSSIATNACRVELRQRLVDALDLEPERELEVLLVADDDVDERHEVAVDLGGAGRGRRSPSTATRGS